MALILFEDVRRRKRPPVPKGEMDVQVGEVIVLKASRSLRARITRIVSQPNGALPHAYAERINFSSRIK